MISGVSQATQMPVRKPNSEVNRTNIQYKELLNRFFDKNRIDIMCYVDTKFLTEVGSEYQLYPGYVIN